MGIYCATASLPPLKISCYCLKRLKQAASIVTSALIHKYHDGAKKRLRCGSVIISSPFSNDFGRKWVFLTGSFL